MVRRSRPKQLSPEQQSQFLAAAERLHLSIVGPLISPQCEHYRSLHREGSRVIRWNETGPAKGANLVGLRLRADPEWLAGLRDCRSLQTVSALDKKPADRSRREELPESPEVRSGKQSTARPRFCFSNQNPPPSTSSPRKGAIPLRQIV